MAAERREKSFAERRQKLFAERRQTKIKAAGSRMVLTGAYNKIARVWRCAAGTRVKVVLKKDARSPDDSFNFNSCLKISCWLPGGISAGIRH